MKNMCLMSALLQPPLRNCSTVQHFRGAGQRPLHRHNEKSSPSQIDQEYNTFVVLDKNRCTGTATSAQKKGRTNGRTGGTNKAANERTNERAARAKTRTNERTGGAKKASRRTNERTGVGHEESVLLMELKTLLIGNKILFH